MNLCDCKIYEGSSVHFDKTYGASKCHVVGLLQVFRARLLQLECVDLILLCQVAGMVVCFIVWLSHANEKTCYNHTSVL